MNIPYFLLDGQNMSVYQIKEKFVYLTKTRFVQRCLTDEEKADDDAPDTLYSLPDLDLKRVQFCLKLYISIGLEWHLALHVLLFLCNVA